ncbi:glycyl radical protein [Chloroflexota bacterium]
MSAATQAMKAKRLYKGFVVHKNEGNQHQLLLAEGVKICLERARLATQSYKETEGQPEIIRRAKSLAKVLDDMTVYILDGERIVGNQSSYPDAIRLVPEMQYRFLSDALNNGMRDCLDDKGREEWAEIARYWDSKAIDDRIRAILPDEVKDYVESSVSYCNSFVHDNALGAVDYEFLFQRGFSGIIELAESKLLELKAHIGDFHDTSMLKDYIDRQYFYESAIIVSKAAIRFAHRYRDLARDMTTAEGNAERTGELEEIAAICDRVPENPPRTFHEAVQAHFFCHLIRVILSTDGSGEGSRFDQLMYPYYKRDIEEGRLTRDQAQELLEFEWIKLEELGTFNRPNIHTSTQGGTIFQTVTIGGQTPDGEDATNEMSFLVLDASMAIRTIQPTISLRYHPKINQKLVNRAIDLIKTGIGFPAFLNDNVIIPFFMERGVSLEEARGYTSPGCVTVMIPGRNMDMNCSFPGGINFAKCLELALNQGKDMRSGKLLGYPTPDPTTLASVEGIMDAFLKQIAFMSEKVVKIARLSQVMHQQYMQLPFQSALIEDCMEKGIDCRKPTYDHQNRLALVGAIDVANSMAAIEKLVFDDKVVDMHGLLEACKANWEGNEDLRQKCMQAPKYGNDDDYVDMLARDVHHGASDALANFRGLFGTPWIFDGGGASGYYGFGRSVWALPDGRKAKDTLADGTVSPKAGTDKQGPTAVLKSMSKVEALFPELANQKFMPQFLDGGNKDIFAAYLKTWSELPIWHIQFNVASAETLRDAQERPGKHSDLIVRVAGYSAYFVYLARGLQDDIITRTGQSFC